MAARKPLVIVAGSVQELPTGDTVVGGGDVTLTGTQTLTNKTLTTPVINGFSGTGNGTVTGNLTVTGNTTLGDSAADTVTIPGPLSVGSLNGGPLAGFRNRIINGGFAVNQRAVSGTVVLGAGVYGHDRFKGGASGCTYTFLTSNNVTTLTISAGSLQQVIEGANLDTGTYCLSWTGTSTGKIGAGAYSASGVTGSITGGTNTTIEFSAGTLSRPQLTPGTVATPFEARPIGTELALCQRYYQRNSSTFAAGVAWPSTSSTYAFSRAYNTSGSTNSVPIFVQFPVQMRTPPTVSLYYDINDGATTGPVAPTWSTPTSFIYVASIASAAGIDLDDWQASSEL